jgi:hypothetical protein
MEDHELVLKLQAKGYRIGNPAIRKDGILLSQINDVFMFQNDVLDLANGTATLQDIIERNKGKVFPNASE